MLTDQTSEIARRREAIDAYLFEQVAIDRLANKARRERSLRVGLLGSFSPDEVEAAMTARLECRRLIGVAMAYCLSVYIAGGVVVCTGRRAAEMSSRLARFNQRFDGSRQSVAAFYLTQMHREDVA